MCIIQTILPSLTKTIYRPSKVHNESTKEYKVSACIFICDPYTNNINHHYIEPTWKGRIQGNLAWDFYNGRYMYALPDGIMVEWDSFRYTKSKNEVQIIVKVNDHLTKMQIELNKINDVVDELCKSPNIKLINFTNDEYIKCETITTSTSCTCAENFFYSKFMIHDKNKNKCMHQKQLTFNEIVFNDLTQQEEPLCCSICQIDFIDLKEIEYICQQPNCDHIVCNSCYTKNKNKFNCCPFCRTDYV